MAHFFHEIRALLRLALPVSLAQLALVGMTATDVLIAGNASTVDLAGMNLGTNTWNMIVMFFMGIGFATQPLVARSYGAGNMPGVKHQLHQSLWMCLGLGFIAMLFVWLAAWSLAFLDYETTMLSIARQFLFVIGLCAIPATLIPAVRGALEGMSETRPVLWINLAAFLINIPLDYVLVNGLYGAPKLGGVGCAWATVSLVWCMFLANVLVLKWHSKLKHLDIFSHFELPNRQSLNSTFSLGFPIGISIVIELSMFCGAGMMIAAFGPIEASAHAVAITVASMSFMLYMGLAQGVTIRASQFLGANKPNEAWYTVKAGTLFNILISVIMCVAFLVFTEPLVRLFSKDSEVIQLAVVLLYFGAAFQIADSVQVAVLCALRAYGDTVSPPKYQFLAFWVFGLPVGIGFAFYHWFPGLEGAKGLWLGMVASLFLVGVLLLKRLANMAREQLSDEAPESKAVIKI
jgi:MATE family multidrug resistance protein